MYRKFSKKVLGLLVHVTPQNVFSRILKSEVDKRILMFKINSVLRSLLGAFNHFHEMLLSKISIQTHFIREHYNHNFFLRFAGIEQLENVGPTFHAHI